MKMTEKEKQAYFWALTMKGSSSVAEVNARIMAEYIKRVKITQMEALFSRLSPAQIERLALFIEEMGEALQMVGKVFRHGYDSRHPEGKTTNREDLEKEIGHIESAVDFLCGGLEPGGADLKDSNILKAKLEKQKGVMKYLHHQGGWCYK